MMKVDLNSDLGESFGQYKIGNDDEVLKHVTSVNIACGFHAGDPQVMEKTVEKAFENNVAVGAHPGYPDLKGFGRRPMQISPEEAKAYVMYQVSALNGFVKALGGKMQHVKPHGAFYNMAAVDATIAQAIAEGVYAVDPNLILMGLANGELVKAGNKIGLQTASEVFADRTYTNKGTLVSRTEEGSVIYNKEQATEQILHIVLNGKVKTIDGGEVELNADSICVHGDNYEAVELVKHLRKSLIESNVTVQSLSNQ